MNKLAWMTPLALCGALLALSPLQAQGPSAALKGQVLEVQNVPGYTYLRLKTPAGESWAAVPTAAIKPGASVVIINTMVMHDFQSKSLKRQFDRIVFGALDDGKAGPAHAAPGTAATPGMQMRPVAPATPVVGKLARASGPEGRSVAEVVLSRTALKDKMVQVRGQVVKVNAGIMGKNWLHLQDGSGNPQEGSHDLLVTSTESAQVGDVIQVRGTVRTDVTLGPGYQYAVLIEGASLRK